MEVNSAETESLRAMSDDIQKAGLEQVPLQALGAQRLRVGTLADNDLCGTLGDKSLRCSILTALDSQRGVFS